MDITEKLVSQAALDVTGSATIEYRGHSIDTDQPWRRVSMREIVREYSEIDYMDYPDAASLEAAIRALGEKVKPGQPWGKLVEHLFSEFAEPKLIAPTFVCDYPRDISPFAKGIEGDPLHTERFELYIGGMEIANAFTELNDPLDQEARFLEMAKLYRAGDDDETPIDQDFLRAMRFGMPPTGGFGMGVDRLLMLLIDQQSIRDILLFPHMRDEQA
jgi:lysyl-tRNA synthetase class 2